MSHEPPDKPPPIPGSPEPNAQEPATSQSDLSDEDLFPAAARRSQPQSQTFQTLQQLWQDIQPRLKAGTITTLKATIQLLESAVAQLESQPEPVTRTAAPSGRSRRRSRLDSLLLSLQTGWQRFWSWWNTVLPKLRRILPASVNQALTDRALTGAIAGMLVIALWTTSSLFSSKPPTQVATAPPSKTAPAPKPTTKKPIPQVKVIPPPLPATDIPQPTTSPTPSPIATVTPSPIASPNPSPSPSASPSPSPTPTPPPLKLTPEQKLIAQIQDQVAEVSDRFVSGLIQSVQANFRASQLTVKVDRGWDALSQPQQDKVANDILDRAQQLNFSKLELVDPQGTLLARSPVIGSEMVILHRGSGESSQKRAQQENAQTAEPDNDPLKTQGSL